MYRSRFPATGRWPRAARATLAALFKTALAVALAGGPAFVLAQTAAAPKEPDRQTLRQAFEAAWSRQPEAQALAARRDAVRAQQQAVQSWTPEPVALELATKTDRLNRNLGVREFEVGVAIPLWLPGERGQRQSVADAEGRAVESRTTAAQLRVAATVRDAWWTWQRSRAELEAARGQLDNARRIAADVGRRLKAGDLARADQHQAEGAVAAAEATAAQAEASLAVASQQLASLTAVPGASGSLDPASADAEPDPSIAAVAAAGVDVQAETHAEMIALKDRVAVAEGQAVLAATQSRANPELTIATTRDRSAFGESYQQTFTVGVRIPFGSGPRHDARVASARAEAAELQAQLALERAHLTSERESARLRTDAARSQLAAAVRRAQLASESRGFFDKSFRLGETDLPTRLRIEAEAVDAERQAARARIELAAAISAWRQALGLLP
ncbi:Outer membrane efflux protein [Rubrivivax sp. A210]|uniref:TolC family protein n=1 Tax=Rubrivivax sp. A210 TaxID=2772301 RepID=UPI00191B66F6|nr:TolC family protein [Rubrivivax sp. A210]CAD5366644.1 Outer membrane efflux protein [Rubrivivax sp. A210]